MHLIRACMRPCLGEVWLLGLGFTFFRFKVQGLRFMVSGWGLGLGFVVPLGGGGGGEPRNGRTCNVYI